MFHIESDYLFGKAVLLRKVRIRALPERLCLGIKTPAHGNFISCSVQDLWISPLLQAFHGKVRSIWPRWFPMRLQPWPLCGSVFWLPKFGMGSQRKTSVEAFYTLDLNDRIDHGLWGSECAAFVIILSFSGCVDNLFQKTYFMLLPLPIIKVSGI